MFNRRRILLGATAFAAAAGISSVLATPAYARNLLAGAKLDDEVIAWLKKTAMPLTTAEPGSGFGDLEPLRNIIGDSRIVSLGEATHGTREFFQLKHRVIQFCVSELGFTMIGFEAEYGATLAVNEYVIHGKGSAAEAVAGMGFWTWNTDEVVALVEWVRAWNLAHDRPVKFYGFDMQASAAAGLHVLSYLERMAPKLAKESEEHLAPLVSYATFFDFNGLPEDRRDAMESQISDILEAFDDERNDWISQSSELEWRLARQSATVLEQFTQLKIGEEAEGFAKVFTIRDESMADNVRTLLRAEGRKAKAVLWAHNGHVQKTPFAPEYPNMGSHLQEEFDDDLVVIGFAFNQGSFGAVGMVDGEYELKNFTVGPAPAGFLDAALATAGMPLLALDLTSVPKGSAVSAWMESKPPQRMIGALFEPESENKYAAAADPRDNYDVLLFVDTTNAAQRKWGDRRRASAPVVHEEPTNLALAGNGEVPDGWRLESRSLYAYSAAAAAERSPDNGVAMKMTRATAPLWWGDGVLTQTFSAAEWHSQHVVFSASIRAEAPRIGTGAQLVVIVQPKKPAGADQVAKPMLAVLEKGPVRSAEWATVSVGVDVPEDAERIQIALVVTGNSAGWFGDLAVKAEGFAETATMMGHSKPNRASLQPLFLAANPAAMSLDVIAK